MVLTRKNGITRRQSRRDRIGQAEERQNERRVLYVHGFPTVNKAINFISRVLKLIRIGTAGTGEYNSTCLIPSDIYDQCELWAFRSTGRLAPRSRGVLPTFTVRSRMHGPHHTCTHLCSHVRQVGTGARSLRDFTSKRYLMSRPPQ